MSKKVKARDIGGAGLIKFPDGSFFLFTFRDNFSRRQSNTLTAMKSDHNGHRRISKGVREVYQMYKEYEIEVLDVWIDDNVKRQRAFKKDFIKKHKDNPLFLNKRRDIIKKQDKTPKEKRAPNPKPQVDLFKKYSKAILKLLS